VTWGQTKERGHGPQIEKVLTVPNPEASRIEGYSSGSTLSGGSKL